MHVLFRVRVNMDEYSVPLPWFCGDLPFGMFRAHTAVVRFFFHCRYRPKRYTARLFSALPTGGEGGDDALSSPSWSAFRRSHPPPPRSARFPAFVIYSHRCTLYPDRLLEQRWGRHLRTATPDSRLRRRAVRSSAGIAVRWSADLIPRFLSCWLESCEGVRACVCFRVFSFLPCVLCVCVCCTSYRAGRSQFLHPPLPSPPPPLPLSPRYCVPYHAAGRAVKSNPLSYFE